MRCEHCHGIMMGGRSRTVLDESDSLAITAWRCPNCNGVVEELYVLSRNGQAQPRRIRYAVSPFVGRKTERLLVHDARMFRAESKA